MGSGSLISPEKWDTGGSDWFWSFSDVQDYVGRLQDEMKKIEAFEKELPLCMILVKDEIERVNKEQSLMEKKKPTVFQEFLPLKKEEDEKNENFAGNENRDKLNWMSSVQLWTFGNQNHSNNNNNIKKRTECHHGFEGRIDEAPLLSLCISETKKMKEEIISTSGLSPKSSSSRSETPSPADSKLTTHPPQTGKKQRRCWSIELHRCFVEALQHLGGAQAATPKQIRELMQLDSLTNDEVKSHLQKYRLHLRRSPAAAGSTLPKPHSLLPLVGSSTAQDQEEDDDDISEINNYFLNKKTSDSLQ